MNEIAWKAYDEVHFSDQYILRWVREGDEYVNKITKEMMEDLKSVVRQQQAEIEALKERLRPCQPLCKPSVCICLERNKPMTTPTTPDRQDAQRTPLTEEQIMDVCICDGVYDCINDPYTMKDGRYSLDIDLVRFARAIERAHGIGE